MTRYCLDANVLIESARGPYGFDIVPAFWTWLDEQATSGSIYSSTFVYDELAGGDDELAEWVRERRGTPLFVAPEEEVQSFVGVISDYVVGAYPAIHAQHFLDGADPWVIAHAKVEGAIVVTREKPVPSNSKKVKIPNVCAHFSVPRIDTYELMRALNLRLR